jgi:hypothetical protein
VVTSVPHEWSIAPGTSTVGPSVAAGRSGAAATDAAPEGEGEGGGDDAVSIDACDECGGVGRAESRLHALKNNRIVTTAATPRNEEVGVAGAARDTPAM